MPSRFVKIKNRLKRAVVKLDQEMYRRSGRKGGKKGKSASNRMGAAVMDVIKSSHVGPAVRTVTNPTDLSARPRNWLITQTPPRNFWQNVVWIRKTVTLVNAASISTSVPTEGNLSFTAQSLFPEYSTLLSLYDQYCIHTVICHISIDSVGSSSGSYGRLTSAIDYDNVANLGGESLVQDFGNAQTLDLEPTGHYERVIQPCCDPQVYVPSSVGYGASRMWLDSASSTIPHYGLRLFFAQCSISGTTYDVVCTSIMGLRNAI